MPEEPEITDKSLLRCTIKKSASVLSKIILYASYCIVGLTAAALAYFGIKGLYELGAPALEKIYVYLAGVPWYYYAGAIALAAIPVYSLLWCIARELTEEDWKSDEASALTVLAPTVLALTALTALAVLALTALTALTALALAVLALTALSDDSSSMWYYAYRFVGAAYHHYKKKKNNTSKGA